MLRTMLLLVIVGAGPAAARSPALAPTSANADRMTSIVARAAARSGHWQAAARLWRAITVASPADAEAWAGLGAALIRLGPPEDAVAALGRAEALAPGQSAVALDRGRAELALGRGAEAAAAFGVATHVNPGDPRGWTGLGVAFDLLGAHGEADTAYARALAIDPLNTAARHNRQLSSTMALAAAAFTPAPTTTPQP